MITKNIKTVLAATFVALGLFVMPLALGAHVVYADKVQNALCDGATNLQVNTDSTATDCDTVTTGSTDKVNSTITQVVNIFSTLVGVIAVIMIIFGGLRYITSGGDSGKITTAKNTIIYALIGLVVVALAQFIVKFVLNKATSTT